jgi:hypothetical protein
MDLDFAVHIWTLGPYTIISAYAFGDLQMCVYVKKFIDDLLGNHKLSPGSTWSKPVIQMWKH